MMNCRRILAMFLWLLPLSVAAGRTTSARSLHGTDVLPHTGLTFSPHGGNGFPTRSKRLPYTEQRVSLHGREGNRTRKGEGAGKPNFRVRSRASAELALRPTWKNTGKRACEEAGLPRTSVSREAGFRVRWREKPEGLPAEGLRRTTKSWQGAKPDDGKPPHGGSSRHRLQWSRTSAS